MVFLFTTSTHIFEAMIYIRIWRSPTEHHKRTTPTLRPEEVKRRMRTSAVSLVCDMYLFISEIVVSIIFGTLSAYGSTNSVHLSLLIWQFTFPIKNSIQAMSTAPTRMAFLRSCLKLRRAFCLPGHLVKKAKKAN